MAGHPREDSPMFEHGRENLSKTVSVRMTEREFDFLNKEAERTGLGKADILRRALGLLYNMAHGEIDKILKRRK